MNWIVENWVTIVVALVCGWVLFGNKILAKIYGVQAMSSAQLAELLKNNEIDLIDVRTPGEYNQNHIREAKLYPLNDLNQSVNELRDKYKDKPLAVICASGNRSTSACIILKKAGLEQVYNISGGMMSWS